MAEQQGTAPEGETGDETELGEKTLEQMTKTELYELATDLEIVGRKNMNRAELEQAVRERQAFNDKQGDGSEEGDNEESDEDELDEGDESDEPAADEGAGGDEGAIEESPATQPAPPQSQPPGPDPLATVTPSVPPPAALLVATEEQLRRIRQGQTHQLAEIVKDPELPDYLRAPVQAELERRAGEERARKAQEALKSKIQQYRVTKGGRYVTKSSYVTTLPEDSVINHMTHDLKHVAEQGIEFEPLHESRIERDQLGVIKHIVR